MQLATMAAGSVCLAIGIATARRVRVRRAGDHAEATARDAVDTERKRIADAVDTERKRIADELHDVVAHDLTVIAMHARLLEQGTPPSTEATSQKVILDAACKALRDLRRVVDSSDCAPLLVDLPADHLKSTLRAAQRELEAIGTPIEMHADLPGQCIPRTLDTILARILREAITNILKHGGQGSVRISINIACATIMMCVANRMYGPPGSIGLPSGHHGITRLSARAHELGGSLRAGPEGQDWVLRAAFPISPRGRGRI